MVARAKSSPQAYEPELVPQEVLDSSREPYFIVGLSGGNVEGTLPLDLARYMDAVDRAFLFDEPVLRYVGENGCLPPEGFDGWDEACLRMEVQLRTL